MEEIKWILYTLYITGYTSLIWATVIWDGIKVGSNNIEIGFIILVLLTLFNISAILAYLCTNWNKE